MNFDKLMQMVVNDKGLEPTPWDKEGASEMQVKFQPDGSYTKQIRGTWKPVAQFASRLAKGNEPAPSLRGLSPDTIFKFMQGQQQGQQNKQQSMGMVANASAQQAQAGQQAREQAFEEHKFNNPDLIQIPGMPTPVRRQDVPQALKAMADVQVKQGKMSLDKYKMVNDVLDSFSQDTLRQAQGTSAYASAQNSASSAAKNQQMRELYGVQTEAAQRELDEGWASMPLPGGGYVNMPGKDLPSSFWRDQSGGGGSEDDGMSADQERLMDNFNNLRYGEEGERTFKPMNPAELSDYKERFKRTFGSTIADIPVERFKGSNMEGMAYVQIPAKASPEDTIAHVYDELLNVYEMDHEDVRRSLSTYLETSNYPDALKARSMSALDNIYKTNTGRTGDEGFWGRMF